MSCTSRHKCTRAADKRAAGNTCYENTCIGRITCTGGTMCTGGSICTGDNTCAGGNMRTGGNTCRGRKMCTRGNTCTGGTMGTGSNTWTTGSIISSGPKPHVQKNTYKTTVRNTNDHKRPAQTFEAGLGSGPEANIQKRGLRAFGQLCPPDTGGGTVRYHKGSGRGSVLAGPQVGLPLLDAGLHLLSSMPQHLLHAGADGGQRPRLQLPELSRVRAGVCVLRVARHVPAAPSLPPHPFTAHAVVRVRLQ
jgi:hypothetical protein